MQVRVQLSRDVNCKEFGANCGDIIEMDVERYLRAVVAAEIANSPLSACEAQAIAARSFALALMRTRGYVRDTTDQAFIVTKDAVARYPNAIKGVENTRGKVLMYNGGIVAAQYGASNGGCTRKYKNYPYFAERDDPWDAAETMYRKSRKRIS